MGRANNQKIFRKILRSPPDFKPLKHDRGLIMGIHLSTMSIKLGLLNFKPLNHLWNYFQPIKFFYSMNLNTFIPTIFNRYPSTSEFFFFFAQNRHVQVLLPDYELPSNGLTRKPYERTWLLALQVLRWNLLRRSSSR